MGTKIIDVDRKFKDYLLKEHFVEKLEKTISDLQSEINLKTNHIELLKIKERIYTRIDNCDN